MTGVRSPDRNIEGTVENIGWRVTRIRTFDKRPLYVPNSVFTQVSIENPSRMSHRRIYETIGVRYGDFAQVHTICDKIEAFLQGHDEIDESQTLMVNFNTFADSSLEFFIYCFTHTTNWEAFHSIKQEVLFKVGEIINNEDAEIAFPSRSIYMENNVPLQNVDRNDAEHAQHKAQSGKLLKTDESNRTEHKGRKVSKNGPDVGESDGGSD
ncbi:mechanosensitive ion channel family protein [Pseudomonas sp. HK3]